MAEDTPKARELIAYWEELKGERGTFEAHWQQIARYVVPYRADYTTERTPGAKRMQYVFNATQILAHQTLASGLHGLLCSPYLPWFFVETDSDALNQRDDVADWLFQIKAAMERAFQRPEANFATAAHEFFTDTTSIGTGCMTMPADEVNGVRFKCYSMKEVCIDEDADGQIDTSLRMYPLSARKAVKQWGDAAPAKVRQAAVDTPTAKFRFLHAQRPRPVRDPGRADSLNMPVESVTLCIDTMEQIDEGGFRESVFQPGRHERLSGDLYGESPATKFLPDIKELQEREKMLSKAGQKALDPGYTYADDAYIMRIKTWPGALNAHRSGTPPEDQLRPIPFGGSIPIGVELLDRKEQIILKGFKVDWLLMPGNLGSPASDGKGITATYTTFERDQKMRLFAPELGRYESEALGPWVQRVFKVEWRRSARLGFNQLAGSPFPPPPAILMQRKWKWHIRYVSPIAIAQRSASLDGIERLLQLGAQLAQFDPQEAQVFDGEGTLRYAGKTLSAPPLVFRSAQQLMQLRQQNAAAARTEQATKIAGAAKDGSAALKNVAQAHQAVVPEVAPLAAAGTPFGLGARPGLAA